MDFFRKNTNDVKSQTTFESLHRYFGDLGYELSNVTGDLTPRLVKDVLKQWNTLLLSRILKKDEKMVICIMNNSTTIKLFEYITKEQSLTNSVYYNYMFVYKDYYLLTKINKDTNFTTLFQDFPKQRITQLDIYTATVN